MTVQQEKLQRIVKIRSMFMHKKWDKTEVDFSHSTFIAVKFINTPDDFRETRYPPDTEKVIDIQQRKLLSDVKSFVGGNKFMDELQEVLVG